MAIVSKSPHTWPPSKLTHHGAAAQILLGFMLMLYLCVFGSFLYMLEYKTQVSFSTRSPSFAPPWIDMTTTRIHTVWVIVYGPYV